MIAKGGQHIDEFGNFIEWQNDEDYIYVDSGGREVERESGDFKVEFSPFLDDEGDEVSVPTTDEGKSEEEEVPKKSTPKKKATRRKSPAKAQTEKNKEVKSKEEPS